MILAPGLYTSFDCITFDENASNTGYYQIPPDPSGAAGPNHVVLVVNSSIEWYTKDGTLQNSQSLKSFFSSLEPQTNTFDPKVLYDQYQNRFVVITLEKQDNGANDPANTSFIYMAVSDDSDPNGTWYFHAIDAKTIVSSNDHWADYPGFALDAQAIYVACNIFTFGSNSYGGSRLWITAKGSGSGGFYDGGTATTTVHDPASAVGESSTTMQPAHMFGTAPDNVGTFLVRYSGYSDGTNEFLSIIRVDNPLATPSFTHQFVNIGDIEDTNLGMPNAPQQGSSNLINTGDRRALHAVWRNNSLYTVFTTVPASGADANEATAHWTQVNTSALSSLSLTDQGSIGGEDIAAGAYTFYPSVAVDGNGNIAVSFAASASSIYPGAYYTGRLSGDAAGTMQPASVLREGLDYYYRAFGGSRNRWGDYSGISVSPDDDQTFWVFNEYALTRGTVLGSYPDEDGRWGTAFGSFSLQATTVPAPSNLQITDSTEAITLTWNDNAKNKTLPIYDKSVSKQGTSQPRSVAAADFFRVYRSTDGNIFSLLKDNVSTTTYQDTTVAIDSKYWYYVTAVVATDESAPSNVDAATVVQASPIVEIVYDDGSPDGGYYWSAAGTGSGNRITPPGYVKILKAKYYLLTPNTGSNNFTAKIFSMTGGQPDAELAAVGVSGAASNSWVEVDFSSFNLYTDQDFLVFLEYDGTNEPSFGYDAVDNGRAWDYDGSSWSQFNETYFMRAVVDCSVVSGIEQPIELGGALPEAYQLEQNFPNPFNPSTTIRYQVPAGSGSSVAVRLEVYNLLGEKVATLVDEHQQPGHYQISFEANRLASGVYVYKLQAGSFVRVRKMMLLR